MRKDLIAKVKGLAERELEYESEELEESKNMGASNSYGAGYSSGVMYMATQILRVIEGGHDDL